MQARVFPFLLERYDAEIACMLFRRRLDHGSESQRTELRIVEDAHAIGKVERDLAA